MKIEGLLFTFLAVFLGVVAAIYGWLSAEWAGATMLALSGGLALIICSYLLITARRMEARPEDRPDAEISEGAGEMGFFAPHSWWPIAMAASFAITMSGIAFGPFLTVIGGAFLAAATMGLLFEYYVGMNRTQGHTLSALQAMGESPTSPHKWLGE